MDSVFSGVSNWLSCGSNVVDRWFFGEGEDETSSSSSGEEGNVSDDSTGTSSSESNDESSGDSKTTTTSNRRNRKKASNGGVGVVSPGGVIQSERLPQIYSWGYNYFGQCASNSQSIIQLPTRVEQLINMQLRVLAMASGDSHVLAIVHPGNQVYAWGCNRWGQLGTGDQTNRATPTPIAIATPTVFTSVSCGAQHSMALSNYGELYSWGCGTGGRTGHGSEAPSLSPQVVSALVGKQITSMAGGMLHSAATDLRGSVYTWGWNKYGQLGNNTAKKHLSPNKLRDMEKHHVVKVTCGKNHTHLLTAEGHIYSFGFNVCGQLGVGGYADSQQPKKVDLPEHAVDIVSGYYHTLCLTNKGNVYSWGYMSDGALGLGDIAGHQSKPKLIPLSHIRHNYSDSMDSYNSIYESGGEGTNPRYAKGDVAEKIAAGAWNSAIITTSGKLYCFGFGDSYRIGNGTNTEDQDIPCQVKSDEWGIEKLIQVEPKSSIDQIFNSISINNTDKKKRSNGNSNSNIITDRNNHKTKSSDDSNNNNNNNNISNNINNNNNNQESPQQQNPPTNNNNINNTTDINLNNTTNTHVNNNTKNINQTSQQQQTPSIIVKAEIRVTNVSIGSGFTFAIVKNSLKEYSH
ncbi:hypothetical protein DFA_11348 [Cavenderia fasciculata]|uniref:RCC1-like domain-containing protein n=1 Tax=Cavenderia fasciculata TaxID=261658 RepID=F4QCF2_CACFS|nr:uncharacterized protein DFA_11348 [Cavenderia fasciculata]EGG13587.1 hypothetical protein DFA_11348 [Cavenderia fasciculata]|eukprot:XP_004350291.1 hypothetical protein DFA_11348 [Cavenderia fasciculata]